MRLVGAIFLCIYVYVAKGASVGGTGITEHVGRGGRIVGGATTSIEQYPYAAAMLFNYWGLLLPVYSQACGASILTSRTLLSAAHCYQTLGVWHRYEWWRVRVGSSTANSGGFVHEVARYIAHPDFDGFDHDLAILRTHTDILYSDQVRPCSIAGGNYRLTGGDEVWAIGWGVTRFNGFPSERLRHVQIWIVEQETCRARNGPIITDNMLCSGWLDVGGKDQCQGDSGGPLLHNHVVVGISSFGYECGHAYYPGVNTRVSAFTDWIVDIAGKRKARKRNRNLLAGLWGSTEVVESIAVDMYHPSNYNWRAVFTRHSFNAPRSARAGSGECTVAKSLIRSVSSWLSTHEETQVMVASVLVVLGVWWLVRALLALIFSLVCPIALVLLAVVCVPQLREPLLGQNYPAVAELLRKIMLKMADKLKTV